jgi:hypothetical protein
MFISLTDVRLPLLKSTHASIRVLKELSRIVLEAKDKGSVPEFERAQGKIRISVLRSGPGGLVQLFVLELKETNSQVFFYC